MTQKRIVNRHIHKQTGFVILEDSCAYYEKDRFYPEKHFLSEFDTPFPLKMDRSLFSRVLSFHQKFRLFYRNQPGESIPEEEQLMRIRLMAEEFSEVIEAIQSGNIKDIAKELSDLIFTTVGTAVVYGIPIDECFQRVYESNLTKSFKRDQGGKILKGESYIPPNLDEVL